MELTSLYIGQIVDDDYWKDNAVAEKWKNTSDIPGWGKRYKVRISGIHSENKSELPDSQLPWLEVMYPVTAGTGHKASYQTANLSQGSFVIVASGGNLSPMIIGCLGNNEQTKLSYTLTDTACIPFSGFIKEEPPVYNISAEGNVIESASNIEKLASEADKSQLTDGTTSSDIAVSTTCEKIPLGSIQIKLKKFIKDITAAQARIKKQQTTIGKPIRESGKSYGIDEYVNYKIQNVSTSISAPIKTLITNIQQYVTKQINDKLKNLYYLVFPNDLEKVKSKIETANDLLACLFRKIIRNLIKMCANFLKSAAERFINTPLCSVENFVGSLIGKIMGFVTSSIDSILTPLKSVLGVFDIIGDILGFVSGILSSISCDEEPVCPKIKEWSIWDGPATGGPENVNISGIVDKMRQFAVPVDPDKFDFNLDFTDVFQDSCNIGAIFCGPPIVKFSGGGGSGAAGNAIISRTGQIIGVDITNSGRGYTTSPNIDFYDSCGRGSGAIGMASIGKVIIPIDTLNNSDTNNQSTRDALNNSNINSVSNSNINNQSTQETIGVTNIFIMDSGSGYLQTQDGSTGGDGRTLTEPIAERSNIYPSKTNGQYPVIMKLEEIFIEDGGSNYSPNDKITIDPPNGASVIATVSATGVILKVDVIDSGEGFKELPRVYIRSTSGSKAKLMPRLGIERVGDNLTTVPNNPERVINVIDCPGK
jgi:hypothetical protein